MKVKINPNFGRWEEVSGGGGNSNQLTTIQQQINQYNSTHNNAASPVGYAGSVTFLNQNFNAYSSNSSSVFDLPNINLKVTSVLMTFINTSGNFYVVYLVNNNNQYIYPNTTGYSIGNETIYTFWLSSDDYYIKNNQLTWYYNVNGNIPASGESMTYNITINYIIQPN